MIVLDASAVIEMLLNTPSGPAVTRRIANEILHAPTLIDLEVAQTLRRYERQGKVSAAQAVEAIDELLSLPLIRHTPENFLKRIWDLRHNFTAYDAAYLALAEGINCPFLTRDSALASAATQGIKVEVI